MDMTTNNTPHVRASELASSVAVAANKLAEAGKVEAMTYWTHDADGFANRVPVTEVMWDTTNHHGSRLVFVLANGQEFEAEVVPSSKALREARRELDRAETDARKEV
jgi:hypothetical protein